MDNDIVTDAETIENEKKEIEDSQELHAEELLEVDEAAGSAEGMDNREDNILSEDVKEDRDATPPEGLELAEDSIIQ